MVSNIILDIQTNFDAFKSFVESNKQSEIADTLSKFGKLPNNFKGISILLDLLESDNKNVRLETIKNLAKLADINILDNFVKIIRKKEEFSEIRREAVSAIGRMRSINAIPILIELLDDNDPNVILQAIRALLVFKDKSEIIEVLLPLAKHENEIIRKIIDVEFYSYSLNNNDYIDHVTSPSYMHNTVVQGDVEKILKNVPDGSIHLTFTSPPYYNARDYSIYKSYKSYLKFLKRVFKELHRVTKEGRFFILNTSPIIIPRVGRKYASKRYPIPYDLHAILEDIGWEFIDDIIWKKPEASAKNRVSGFNQHRKPLTYKPNCITECVMVYRKKTHKLIDWNIKQYEDSTIEKSLVNGDILTSNVWNIDPVTDKVHSAAFPYELCDYVIKYFSFIGDLVFDPFGGSGTFGKAAIENNRRFFITELNKGYFERIKDKIDNNIFIDCPPTFIDLKSFKSRKQKDLL